MTTVGGSKKKITYGHNDMTKGQRCQSNKYPFIFISHMPVTKCACCGGDMLAEKDIGSSVLYRCLECGLSDTKVKKQEKSADNS